MKSVHTICYKKTRDFIKRKKEKMKLLITSSDPATVWELQDSTVTQVLFPDLSIYDLYPSTQNVKNILPPELGEKVIVFLFWEYILARDFDQALELAQISKFYPIKLYNELFTKKHDILIDCYKRLARTFMFCEAIDDYMVSPRTSSFNTCLRLTRHGANFPSFPLRPWEFGKYYCTEPLGSLFFQGSNQINEYYIGPNICDTIWVSGEFNSGIMEAEEIYHPVLNMILSDYTENVLPTALIMKRNIYLHDFINLLKKIYGKGLITNFMIKEDDNPFLVATETFISI